MLPFTTEVFFSVFERYNAAIWPVQVQMASALGVGESAASKLYRKGREDQELKPRLARIMWVFAGQEGKK